MKVIFALDKFIEKITSVTIIAAVFSMLLLSVLNIVMRWFGSSFLWIDPLVRHLVFASAFLGGVLATGKGTHIGIEILPKILETKEGQEKKLMAIKAFIALVSSAVLIWLVKASYDFVLTELQYGKEAFLGIHSGFLVMIIPIGFGIIAIRFILQFFKIIAHPTK